MDYRTRQQTTSMAELKISVPNDSEAEQSLLGSILLDNDALLMIHTQPTDFFYERHADILCAMQTLSAEGKPIDLVTLCSKIEDMGKLQRIGGAAYLTALIGSVPSALNVQTYAERVERCALQRRLITAAGEIAGIAYNAKERTDEQIIGEVQNVIMNIDAPVREDGCKTLYDAIYASMPEIMDYLDHKHETWGVPTGLIDLDEIIGGLPFGEMTLIAADPGMGKTMLATTIWLNAGMRGYPGIFFSLEMQRRQLMLRLYAERGDVDTANIRRGKLCQDARDTMFENMAKIENLPLWINDKPQDTGTLAREIMRLQRRVDLKFAIVDYSDLLNDKGETEIVRQKHLAHNLKQIAKATGIALVVVHPITRDAMKQEREPELHDLGWGRAWEYDAHTVLFNHVKKNRNDLQAVIKVGKYRDGVGNKALDFVFDGKRWKDAARGG